jgi:hypothetical protein
VKRAALYLRRVALGLAALTVLVWLVTGAHRGWTQTSVPIEKQDEITGLTYREYQKRFRPGVDFLGAGLLVASTLAVAGWALDRQHRNR